MTFLNSFKAALTGFIFPQDRCLYCGSAAEYQMDHFPIPDACGGVDTVRSCLHCHNMKDRVSDEIALDYLFSSADEISKCYFLEVEDAFILGNASILPTAAASLVDDIRDFPPAVRIMIGRQIRRQLVQMSGVGS